jgi:hypothetical protein
MEKPAGLKAFVLKLKLKILVNKLASVSVLIVIALLAVVICLILLNHKSSSNSPPNKVTKQTVKSQSGNTAPARTPSANTDTDAVIKNPTHLVDDQWNFPASGDNNLSDQSIDIEPIVNGPAIAGNTPDGYFYADEFYYPGNSGKTPSGGSATGYIGLQDQGNDSNGNTLAKSALLVIYGAVSANPSGAATSECGNPSGEGDGCSLHLNYTWQANHTYRFDVSNVGQDDGNNIWSGGFIDLTTGATHQLGTIDMPSSYGLLSNAVITFHERFAGPTDSCTDQMPSSVMFSNMTANSDSLSATPSTPNSYNSPCNFLTNTLSGDSLTSSYALSN